MNTKTIWAIIAVIILLGLGWWLYSAQKAPVQTVEEMPEVAGADNQVVDGSKDGAAATPGGAVVVSYTSEGFSPSTITIKKGQTITFLNKGSQEMWVASDEHPSHTGYDGTNKDAHCDVGATPSFDQCGVSATYSFTFTKVGTWSYHNHREDEDRGSVIVTE